LHAKEKRKEGIACRELRGVRLKEREGRPSQSASTRRHESREGGGEFTLLTFAKKSELALNVRGSGDIKSLGLYLAWGIKKSAQKKKRNATYQEEKPGGPSIPTGKKPGRGLQRHAARSKQSDVGGGERKKTKPCRGYV